MSCDICQYTAKYLVDSQFDFVWKHLEAQIFCFSNLNSYIASCTKKKN